MLFSPFIFVPSKRNCKVYHIRLTEAQFPCFHLNSTQYYEQTMNSVPIVWQSESTVSSVSVVTSPSLKSLNQQHWTEYNNSQMSTIEITLSKFKVHRTFISYKTQEMIFLSITSDSHRHSSLASILIPHSIINSQWTRPLVRMMRLSSTFFVLSLQAQLSNTENTE